MTAADAYGLLLGVFVALFGLAGLLGALTLHLRTVKRARWAEKIRRFTRRLG